MPKHKHKKKPNANPAQIRDAVNQGSSKTMVFCLTVLADKYGFDRDQLLDFIAHVTELAQGIIEGHVRYEDLHRVLVEEKELDW